MSEDAQKFSVDLIRPIYQRITRDAGRELTLDEWHFIIEALIAGAIVRIENGEIEFQFKHE